MSHVCNERHLLESILTAKKETRSENRQSKEWTARMLDRDENLCSMQSQGRGLRRGKLWLVS